MDECVSYAFKLESGYFSIQDCDEGYDYSFFNENYRLEDGGIYECDNVPVETVIKDILNEAGIAFNKLKQIDFEHLEELTAEANAIVPQKSTIEIFREKTNKYFKLKKGISPKEVEEIAITYTYVVAAELYADFKIIDAVVCGSRSRGLEKKNSDIDVVLEYQCEDISEDSLFNLLHQDGIRIAGINLDINPIKSDKSGTLEEYLLKCEKYLEQKSKQIGDGKEGQINRKRKTVCR